MSTQTDQAERIRDRYDIEEESILDRVKQNWLGYLFILPTFLLFVGLFYFPILRGIQITFTRVNLGAPNDFVGLDNYLWVITNDLFVHSLVTTVLYAFSTLVFQIVLGIIAALVLNEIIKGYREWLAALIMAPYFTAGIAAGITWKWFLHTQFGGVTRILQEFNMQPIGFLYQGALPFVSLVLATVWHDFPWSGVIYLAALQGVPSEQYEAAAMDGANRLQRFRQVTLPHLKTPTIIVLAIRTVYQIKEFAIPFELTGGGPANRTLLMSIWTYRIAYVDELLGRAFVVGIIMVVMSLIPAILYIRSIDEEEELYV